MQSRKAEFHLINRLAERVGCLCLLLASANAWAYGSATKADMVWLPPYCSATRLVPGWDFKSREVQYWISRLGPNHESLHHHCQGLIHYRNANRFPSTSVERRRLLELALSEFGFLLNRADSVLKDFPLWAEYLTRQGEVAALLERWPLAVASYEKARRVKPDYWPAYLDWANVLVRLKLNAQARDLIKQGLLIDPSVESMRQAFVKLGGSLKDIPNEAPKPPAAPEAASAPDSAASEATPSASAASR